MYSSLLQCSRAFVRRNTTLELVMYLDTASITEQPYHYLPTITALSKAEKSRRRQY